jgi:hypothetical protein
MQTSSSRLIYIFIYRYRYPQSYAWRYFKLWISKQYVSMCNYIINIDICACGYIYIYISWSEGICELARNTESISISKPSHRDISEVRSVRKLVERNVNIGTELGRIYGESLCRGWIARAQSSLIKSIKSMSALTLPPLQSWKRVVLHVIYLRHLRHLENKWWKTSSEIPGSVKSSSCRRSVRLDSVQDEGVNTCVSAVSAAVTPGILVSKQPYIM